VFYYENLIKSSSDLYNWPLESKNEKNDTGGLMKKWWIILVGIVIALGIGVGSAFAFNAAFPVRTSTTVWPAEQQEWNNQNWRGYPGGGMMQPWGRQGGQFGPRFERPGQIPQPDQDDSSTSN
jgi:hypothetical protein